MKSSWWRAAAAVLTLLFADNICHAQFVLIPTDIPPKALSAWRQARNLATRENYKDALPYMDICIKICPNCWDAYLDRATLFSSLGDEEAAKKDWEMVLKNSNKDLKQKAIAMSAIGSYWAGKNDIPTALKYYDQALVFNPHATTTRKGRAQILLAVKQPQKALQDYDILIKTAAGGNDETYRFERARILENISKYPEAISDYDQILLKDSDQDEALYKRSLCRFKLGQMDSALKDINGAIKSSGDNARYLNTRAMLYEKLGKTALANRTAQKPKISIVFFNNDCCKI